MPSSLKGPGRFFSRFFVRPYEPIQVYGSVHNLARVGGVSILCIPKEYAPCDLVIPTRFAATGQFLVNSGCDIPGLFRIPGQTKTITALREHFVSHMYLDHDASPRESDIEVTVRLACLPSQSAIPYNIHDVASTFKHFLGDLQGGILGSVEVFESLRKALLPIVKPSYSELDFQCRGLEEQVEQDDTVNANWVARVLCNIECIQRRNLILAVFGLLAMLKQDPQDSMMDSLLRPKFPISLADALHDHCMQDSVANERMSSKALGLVFAPLLLANLTNSIRIEPTSCPDSAVTRRKSLLGSPRRKPIVSKSKITSHIHRISINGIPVPSSLSPNKSKSSKRDAAQAKELGEGVERNKVAAKMIEIILKSWEDVVECLRETKTLQEAGFGNGKVRKAVHKERGGAVMVRLRVKERGHS